MKKLFYAYSIESLQGKTSSIISRKKTKPNSLYEKNIVCESLHNTCNFNCIGENVHSLEESLYIKAEIKFEFFFHSERSSL